MNIDKVLPAIEQKAVPNGLPATHLFRVYVEDKLLNDLGLRRKKDSEGNPQLVWCLSIGPMSAQGQGHFYFYGYTAQKAIKKAVDHFHIIFDEGTPPEQP